jgi:hypothetical protein
MKGYTLVQHSGYAYAGNPQFIRAVELRSLNTAAEVRKVEKEGGRIFETYGEASDAEYSENYPQEVQGLTPRVQGNFSSKKIEGQRIYVPKSETVATEGSGG